MVASQRILWCGTSKPASLMSLGYLGMFLTGLSYSDCAGQCLTTIPYGNHIQRNPDLLIKHLETLGVGTVNLELLHVEGKIHFTLIEFGLYVTDRIF